MTDMTDLVVWSDPDQYGQTIGTAGRTQMFLILPDTEGGGYFLLTRDLSSGDMFKAGARPYPDREFAQRAAEDVLVRMLAKLDSDAAKLRGM
jgi:hypothetical protein